MVYFLIGAFFPKTQIYTVTEMANYLPYPFFISNPWVSLHFLVSLAQVSSRGSKKRWNTWPSVVHDLCIKTWCVTYILTRWVGAEAILTNSRLCLKRKGYPLPFSFIGLCRWEPHSRDGGETRQKEPGPLIDWSHYTDPRWLIHRALHVRKNVLLGLRLLF